MSVTIHKTSCEGCVFSTKKQIQLFENGPLSIFELPSPVEQTGCSLGVLEKLASKGYPLTLITNHNTRVSHYEIDGKLCPFCRHKDGKFAKEYKPEEYVEKVWQENALSLIAIVYSDKNTSIESISTTLESIDAQETRPTKIVICCNTKPGEGLQAKDIIKKLREKRPVTPYFCKQILERNDGEAVSRERAIDLCVLDIQKTMYYSICDAGVTLQPDVYKELHDAIYKEFEQVLMVEEDGLEIINVLVHQYVGGHAGSNWSFKERVRWEIENAAKKDEEVDEQPNPSS